MEKIGYIVTSRKVNDLPDYIGVVSSVKDLDGADTPLLFVGIENGKKNIEGFSVLKFRYNDKLFWTFGKTENREKYQNDINVFASYCIGYAVSSIKYTYVSPFSLTYTKAKKLLTNIVNKGGWYIYIGDGMAYCFKEKNVIGLSLDILEYCGIAKERVERVMRKNRLNKVVTSDGWLSFNLRQLIKNKKYATPYFMIRNDKQTNTDRYLRQEG